MVEFIKTPGRESEAGRQHDIRCCVQCGADPATMIAPSGMICGACWRGKTRLERVVGP